ncbi:MAG: 4Fe-4S binding protein [Synergistaceae bacterium]|nr:4Fe-4S binding protein [Synergistaceae bacterium]
MYESLVEYFEIPDAASEFIPLFLRGDEIAALEKMGRSEYSPEKLAELLRGVTPNPGRFISEAYSRCVLSKVEASGKTCFRAATFYDRLAYFTQFEPDAWKSIPEERQTEIDGWYVKKYADGARSRLEDTLRDPSKLIENAFFFTLDETLKLIDDLEDDPYVVPCNCKTVALNCVDRKPNEVCILFKKGINSPWDRGHGRQLTRKEAKELIKFANGKGLMQTSEMEAAICNCCGCCCYPVRASRMIGAKGLWPKKVYDVVWNRDRCVGCGKCAGICNFGAFRMDGRKVIFDRDSCWSCTICANHCPVGAITLERI